MCGGRAVRPTLLLEADAEVVAPETYRGALPGHPAPVLDLQSLTAEFDVEAARCLHVERQHLVVDVAAQGRRHRHLATQRTVEAQPDVVAAAHLHHEMDDAAWCLARHEGQAVMTGVHAEEAQPRRRTVRRPANELWWQ